MEGAFSLSPLWNELSIVRKAAPTLKALHGMVLKRILRDIPLPEPGGQKLQTEDILGAVSSFIPQLLLDLSEDNDVLSGIRALAAAEAQRHNPWAIVQASISMWYAEVVPVLAKELKSTEDDTREKWGLDVAWENIDFQELPFANLGLMAMLVVGDIWENPTDLKLQSACLIAHTAVSFLFIARILGPHIIEYPWRSLSTYIQGQRAQELVFKVSLSIAAKGYSLSRPPQGPAIEFNVDPRNIRVSNQGRKLLVRVAVDEEWRSLPFWHPYRRVPGSPWNNYIKNTQWRTFSTSPRPPPTWIKYHLPSSAHTLTDAIEDDYNSLRAQISQENPNLLQVVSVAKRNSQFKNFAWLSGRKYAVMRPDILPPYEAHDMNEWYLYFTPASQAPRGDMGGHLTLPFLTSACHAYELLEDTEQDEDDVFLWTFKYDMANGQRV